MSLDQFTKDGKFLMLALDHRGSIKKLMNSQDPGSVTDEEVVKLKSEIINSVEDQFSGVLIDEAYGLQAFSDHLKPFLLPVEKSGYEDDKGGRINELEFSVQQVKEMGAGGVKLLIYFNPESENSHLQLATANHVVKSCKESDMPLFLEIVTYDQEGKSLGGEGILSSLNRFIDAQVIPNVWKLEYPGSEDFCKKVSELVGEVPWVLLTRGDTYEVFVEELKVAVENGCSGFLAGRALWQEVCSLTGDEKDKFLKEILPERFRKISDIIMANS